MLENVSRKFYIVLTSVISPVSHRPHFALPADCTYPSNHLIGKYRLTIQVTPSPGTSRLFLSQCCIYRYVMYWLKKNNKKTQKHAIQGLLGCESYDFLFLVHDLVYSYTEGVRRFISEKTNCRRFQRGSNTFQWAGGGGGGRGVPDRKFYKKPI